ncbi:M14 family zinc carboxypeptidase [Kitasatospora aburaviensis]
MCTLGEFPNRSVENREIHFVRIANAPQNGRPAVVLTGGVHARESAPPDALVHFAQNILVSRTTGADIVFPAMSCRPLPAGPTVNYPPFTVPATEVERILNGVDLYVAPLINPDGRLFDQLHPPTDPIRAGWRKNRRPHPNPAKVGVDINRNHDIAWKFEDYYNMAVYLAFYRDGPASTNSRDETYRGPSAASEPETSNVQWLIDDTRATYFVDVHQFGRKVLLCWGIEDNGSDPTMTFSSPAWTGKRDGLRPGSPGLPTDRPNYSEFVSDSPPHFVRKTLGTIAGEMRDAILRSAGVDPTVGTANPGASTPPTTSARAPRCTTRWAARSPAPPTTTPSAASSTTRPGRRSSPSPSRPGTRRSPDSTPSTAARPGITPRSNGRCTRR